MKKYIFFVMLVFLSFCKIALAQPYPVHDLDLLLSQRQEAGKTVHELDLKYIDQVIFDLRAHARNYPPSFDSKEDQQRATMEARALMKTFSIIDSGDNTDIVILRRYALLGVAAHNLDVEGAALKTDELYQRILRRAPDSLEDNYLYGLFLTYSGVTEKAIPYLKKVFDSGVRQVQKDLGIAYLMMGDTKKALQNLQAYQKNFPEDEMIAGVIRAIESGNVEMNYSEPKQ